MKISIVVTSLKSSIYLYEQLDSINKQTYKINELILVFDHTNQNSVVSIKNIKKILNNIDNIKIIENERNMGPFNSFSKGLIKTKGDLIFFSDHDDIWKMNKVEICIRHFLKHKPKLIYHNAIISGSDKVFKNGDLVHSKNPLRNNIFNIIMKNNLVGAFLVVDGILARKIAINISLSPMHDWIIYLIIKYNNYKMLFINEPLQLYRRHPNTYTGRGKNPIRKLHATFVFRVQLIYNLIKFNVFKKN
jgi:glycosyltransferase involved in cell wall biosynthesis